MKTVSFGFEVGQEWEARNGDLARIVEVASSGQWPVVYECDGEWWSVTRSGRFLTDLCPHPKDLVARAVDKTVPGWMNYGCAVW
jgi:hypothetical protein